jgi:peptide/nickel transport system ATP-binding protein
MGQAGDNNNEGDLLRIRDLSVRYRTQSGLVTALDDVSFAMRPKEFVALVGESGSGKSTLAHSISRLLPPSAACDGSIVYKGRELMGLSGDEMTKLRGTGIAMIFQEPLSSLMPIRTVGDQMSEAIRVREGRSGMKVEVHDRSPASLEVAAGGFTLSRLAGGLTGGRARSREVPEEVLRWLTAVRIPDPERVAGMYPFELSGGMVQRVMIAMALSLRPSLLLADEPTTALDVTTQAQILKLMRRLADETGTAVLMVTHDLGVAAQVADRVAVIYAGRVMEEASTEELFANPLHPYTQGLVSCYPRGSRRTRRLETIPGSIPDLTVKIEGCKFYPRCSFARDVCRAHVGYPEVGKNHFVRCTLY